MKLIVCRPPSMRVTPGMGLPSRTARVCRRSRVLARPRDRRDCSHPRHAAYRGRGPRSPPDRSAVPTQGQGSHRRKGRPRYAKERRHGRPGIRQRKGRDPVHLPVSRGHVLAGCPGGCPAEVQFHTRSSFEAKQETHAAYERLRVLPEDHEEVHALRAYQQEVTATIPVPPQAPEVTVSLGGSDAEKSDLLRDRR